MKNTSINKSTQFIKCTLSLLFLIIFQISVFPQNAGISPAGTTAPDPAAGLDINFPAKGLLIPRISLTATTSFLPLASHVAGMLVYNTATAGDVVPGFYFNNGTRWVPSLPKANAAGEMQYWDGAMWVVIPAGQPGQLLQINNNGVPAWTGAGYASLSTTAVTSISSTGAVSGGNITSDGGTAVTARGVCWAVTPNPTTANNVVADVSGGTGIFTVNLSGMTTGTLYYLRSYATNTSGTSYGNQLIFMTL